MTLLVEVKNKLTGSTNIYPVNRLDLKMFEVTELAEDRDLKELKFTNHLGVRLKACGISGENVPLPSTYLLNGLILQSRLVYRTG